MRTLATVGTSAELERLIKDDVAVDYVYAYPPRQAYGPVAGDKLAAAISRSLSRPGGVDLYLHFPLVDVTVGEPFPADAAVEVDHLDAAGALVAVERSRHRTRGTAALAVGLGDRLDARDRGVDRESGGRGVHVA